MISTSTRSELQRLAADELKGQRVKELRVVEETDHSGDPILDITVVIEARDDVDVSGKALLRLLKRASDYLLAHGDQRFPHFRFMTTKDAGAHA